MADRLLSVAEVLDRIRVARSTAYLLIERGDLPSVKIGHRRFVLESDLDAFIERNHSGAAR